MRLDDRLIDFFERPLMCIVAATDLAHRPAAGRGIGFHIFEDRETIEIVFSAWQWPRLEAAIRVSARVAATFVSPSDYVSFQLKGSAAIRDTAPYHIECAKRFMQRATGELEALGVPSGVIAPWLTDREAAVARMTISEIYIQTPGPLAGMAAGARVR